MLMDLGRYLRWLIFSITFSFYFLNEVNGQAPVRTYLEGQKTGRIIDQGLLGAFGAGLSSPMTNGSAFYYGTNSILTGSTSHFTTMTASKDVGALGINVAGGNTYIQFRNTGNSILNANTTTYFTLNGMPQTSGIDLDVTGLLGITQELNLIGEAFTGATNYHLGGVPIVDPPKENAGTKVGSTDTRLLINNIGQYIAAVTPNSAYNSVRLNLILSANLLNVVTVARSVSTGIYNAYTETAGGTCSVLGRYTSPPEVGGIALNTGVLGLNTGQLIANPHHVLTTDDQYASYSSGLLSLGVGKTISQMIYFDHKASAHDSFYAKLGLVNNLVGLDLLQLQGITFTAFDGETNVWSGNLTQIASLLGLDLLNLINLGGTHGGLEITAKPGVAFDRIRISFDSGLLGLGVAGDAFRVYNIRLLPAAPIITQPNGQPVDREICMNVNTSFQVQASIGGTGTITSYLWEYFNGTNWVPAEGTNNQATYSYNNVPLSFNGRRYRVAITGGAAGCPSTIYSNDALLTVFPKAKKPVFTLSIPE